MNNEQIKAMTEAFLRWKLPDDFGPDGGIEFFPPDEQDWPTGTNLLCYEQAKAMVEHMLKATRPTAAVDVVRKMPPSWDDYIGNMASYRDAVLEWWDKYNVELRQHLAAPVQGVTWKMVDKLVSMLVPNSSVRTSESGDLCLYVKRDDLTLDLRIDVDTNEFLFLLKTPRGSMSGCEGEGAEKSECSELIRSALSIPAADDGWHTIDSAPRGIPIEITHHGYSWVATGIVEDFEDADGYVNTITTIIHYNGDTLLNVFYATHWKHLGKGVMR